MTPADGGQGASLLWWPQEVTPQETLWALAKEATAAVKRESEAKGGLAFWARMHADKTMFEAMGQEKPPYNPPYTVRALSTPDSCNPCKGSSICPRMKAQAAPRSTICAWPPCTRM